MTALRALSLSLFFCFLACGKYGPPLAPEHFSPEAVKNLQVEAQTQGVLLRWEAPDRNRQGKELKQIDGYLVYRKAADRFTVGLEFEEVARLNDPHLEKLMELRKQAYQAGKPARRVDVTAAEKRFQYLDRSAQLGRTYFYLVVPFNQEDVKGEAAQIVRIRFSGPGSPAQIATYTGTELSEE